MTAAPLPPLPDDPASLVPLSTAARILGFDMQRVYNAARLPSFPHPAAHVACLPVYRISEIAAFMLPGSSTAHGASGAG